MIDASMASKILHMRKTSIGYLYLMCCSIRVLDNSVQYGAHLGTLYKIRIIRTFRAINGMDDKTKSLYHPSTTMEWCFISQGQIFFQHHLSSCN